MRKCNLSCLVNTLSVSNAKSLDRQLHLVAMEALGSSQRRVFFSFTSEKYDMLRHV